MREAFVEALLKQNEIDRRFCFLTGDLGFAMLEPLRDALGERFINAGIAEQNMMSVAAGLCKSGLNVWVYSISPFCYARPLEQVRNDICFHGLPVKIIGSGGGFGYGLAGPTHHALEDCGVMSSLLGMSVYAPCFASDMATVVEEMSASKGPTYLRLARGASLNNHTEYPFLTFRKLCRGTEGLVVALGSMGVRMLSMLGGMSEKVRPSLWVCSRLPIVGEALPQCLVEEILHSEWLMVIEDHVRNGGLGSQLALALLERSVPVKRYVHKFAKGYLSGLYGSEDFHLAENGLSAEALADSIRDLMQCS
jgi:Transketolase, C-terminal subunit